MRWIRSHVAGLTGGWLVVTLCLRAFVPTALCSTMAVSTIGTTCTCGHGDGAMCPMHHPKTAMPRSSDSHDCSCRGTADPMADIAAALIDAPALLKTSPRIVPLARAAGAAVLAPDPGPIHAAIVPVSPPPRG
jgi:hypothetical protein